MSVPASKDLGLMRSSDGDLHAMLSDGRIVNVDALLQLAELRVRMAEGTSGESAERMYASGVLKLLESIIIPEPPAA